MILEVTWTSQWRQTGMDRWRLTLVRLCAWVRWAYALLVTRVGLLPVNVAAMATGCRAGCSIVKTVDGYYVWLATPVSRLMSGDEHVKAWGLVRQTGRLWGQRDPSLTRRPHDNDVPTEPQAGHLLAD